MSILDDLLGYSSADASNQAAGDTYGKQSAASAGLRVAGDDYASGMKSLAEKFRPYGAAGESALARLMAGLGLGGDTEGFTTAYRSLPGYEAGLETGRKSLTGALNTGNMLQSGKALKALTRYGSDYEDQRVGDYLSRLTGVAGMGQQATGQEVATAGQGLGGRLSAYTGAAGQDFNAAGTIGQGMVAGEQAKQNALTNLMSTAGYLGGAALGGPVGAGLGGMMRGSSFSGTKLTPWGGGGYYDQGPVR